MTSISLKTVFDEIFSKQKFDSNFARKIKRYQIEFVHRNPEHREFFGGNLIGVHRVRFGYDELDRFYEEVLNLEYDKVQAATKTVTTINQSFKISSDSMNLTIIYLIHRFLTASNMSPAQKAEVTEDLALIFSYRTIAALLAHYFKYPIDTQTAQAVHERLSGRYLIKRLGTWQAVFEYRAHEFTSKESSFYKAFLSFKEDDQIVNAINDLQGRIKDMLKNIYAEFIQVHESGTKIRSGSATMIDGDGDEIVRDKIHGLEVYTNYLKSVVIDPNSFYKEELVQIVSQVIPTVNGKAFRMILSWMSSDMGDTSHKATFEFIELVMEMAYNYLLKNNHVAHHSKDLVFMVGKLKGFILSSREDSEQLIEFRKKGDEIVRKSTQQRNIQTVAALRNGLFLYLCIRAFTKHRYS